MTGRERLKDIANKWCQWVGPEGDRERYHEIGNAALEALAHKEQLHALALQNVRLREALERLTTITEADNVDSYMLDVHEGERVLAIGKPQAARDVAEMREKARMLDWVEQQIGNVYEGIQTVRLCRDDATNSYIVGIGRDPLAGYGHTLLAALCAAKGEGR